MIQRPSSGNPMSSGSEDDCLRIWQFSDTHLYADAAQELYGINCDISLQQVLLTAQSLPRAADLCLLTGDLVHDYSEAAYQRLLDYFERLAIPAYCLPGNHNAVNLMQRILESGHVSCDNHIVHMSK